MSDIETLARWAIENAPRIRALEAELAEHNEAVRDRDVLAKWIKGQRCCMNPCGGVRTATPDVASAIAKAAIEGSKP